MSRHATGRATRHPVSGRQHKMEALGAAAVAAALVVAPAAAVTDASRATESNVASSPAASGAAPGAPGTPSTWALGDHDGFGTARGTKSKVWYTLRDGTLTDVYYPRIDTPSIRDSQFVVAGKRFTDREDQDARSKVQLLGSRSLVYRVTTTAKSGKWRIVKTFVTDPVRSTVLQRCGSPRSAARSTSSSCCTTPRSP